MGAASGQLALVRPRSLAPSVECLARWWTSASQAERFYLLRQSIHGDPSAPPLRVIQIAAFIAEAEAGEVA